MQGAPFFFITYEKSLHNINAEWCRNGAVLEKNAPSKPLFLNDEFGIPIL